MTQNTSRVPSERELDAALADTFPASDPPAHSVERTPTAEPDVKPGKSPSPLTSPQPVADSNADADLGADLGRDIPANTTSDPAPTAESAPDIQVRPVF